MIVLTSEIAIPALPKNPTITSVRKMKPYGTGICNSGATSDLPFNHPVIFSAERPIPAPSRATH